MAERSVIIRLKGDIAGFKASMREAGATAKNEFSKLQKNIADNRASFDQLGNSAGKVGLAAAAGLGLATKAAMDWESAWAGVTKTVDGSDAQMAALEEDLRELAKTLPATHEEIAGVAEAAGQLGVAREDVAAFTRTMIDLGETTNLSAEDAATTIAQMANVMGTSGDEIDNLGSSLVALGNAGASTERQIIEMAQRIAGAGSQIGLAESDILAIANAAASMGIEVEAGGTAVSKIFTDMAKATATGSEELGIFAEVAGVSVDEFTRAFGEDPAQAFAMFTQGLDRMNQSGGDVFTTLDNLGLADVRVSQALLGMAASGDLLTDSLDLGAQAWKENTALTDEAAKRYETTAAQVEIAFNVIKDEAIDVGAVLLPILADAAGAVASVAEAFGSLPGPVQESVVALGGMVAIFGGGLWFTSKVVGGIADTREALSDLGVTAGKTRTALAAIGQGVQFAAMIYAADALDAKLKDLAKLSLRDSELTRDLEYLAETGKASGTVLDVFGKDLEGFGSNLENYYDGLSRFTDKTFGFLPGATFGEDFEENAKKIDDALAMMAETGDVEAAARVWEMLEQSAKDAGVPVEDLTRLFPEYAQAAEIAASKSQEAGDGASGAAGGFAKIGDAAGDAAGEVDGFTQALEDLDAVLEGRSEMRDYEQAVDDFSDALKERKEITDELREAEKELAAAETPEERRAARQRIADLKDELEDYALTLDISTQAGRDWEERLDNLAETALTAAENLEGMDRKRYLRKARQDFIDAATDLGKTKREARDLWDDLVRLDEIDPTIAIDVKFNIEKAPKITGPGGATYDLHVSTPDGGTGGRFWDGGYTGPGGKYEPAGVVHAGEFVHDQDDTRKHRGLFEAIHAGRDPLDYLLRGYSGGGLVTSTFASRPAPLPASVDGGLVDVTGAGGAPLIGSATFMLQDFADYERQTMNLKRQRAIGGMGGGRR